MGSKSPHKNHKYIEELARKNSNKIFVVTGNNNKIFKDSSEEDISNMIYTGYLKDEEIAALYKNCEAFIFPSLYEGMPNTVIEAQATGLPCIISDTITKEADITGLVEYVSLEKTAEEWAEIALSVNIGERRNTHTDFIENGYDIKQVAEKFIATVCP